MQPRILTVGHSTHPIEEFLELLRGAGVTRVVHVRTLAGSRHNPQFNQENLAPSLEAAGIAYLREQRLGGLRKATVAVDPEVNGFWENQSFHRYADYALGTSFAVDLATFTSGDLTATLENILARTDETTSATTLARQATDPARQLGVQVTRYSDALTAAAEQHLGPAYLANLEAQADQLVLWLSAEPAWPTLRGHLIQFATHGHDPLVVLRDALAQGDLGTADDPAAVLDWRIDPTRHLPTGPLPWLPGVPQRLAEDPAWGPYLTARAELVGELASRVRATPIDVDQPPEWLATPREPMPLRLVQDVQVWRAATGTPDHDLRPTGGAAATAASAREQRRLDAGLSRVGMPDIAPWWEQLAPLAPHIARDPEIRQLAVWLDGMAGEGIDVTSMLDAAIKDGPLPVDHTLAALNYRLERHHPSLRYGWPPLPEQAGGPRPPRPEDLPSHRPRPGRGTGF